MRMTKTTGRMTIDRTLADIIVGILVFGLILQLILIWFVSQKLFFCIGLWTGILTACVYAYHIWWSLDRNLTVNADNERGATAFSLKHSVIRYAAVALVLLGLWYIGGNTSMLAGFAGVLGIKVGAYLQPVISRFTGRFFDKQ